MSVNIRGRVVQRREKEVIPGGKSFLFIILAVGVLIDGQHELSPQGRHQHALTASMKRKGLRARPIEFSSLSSVGSRERKGKPTDEKKFIGDTLVIFSFLCGDRALARQDHLDRHNKEKRIVRGIVSVTALGCQQLMLVFLSFNHLLASKGKRESIC